ncbi:fused DSP-PTPase phosphatase/NAD kinase-like protein [Zavarzinella formosa]|uniref:fused DSP-PTPase phosphatase/NAD kinase-like protein n=1 Tax=Zavarzinella formosa TaxID=360055 RepID=UPI000317F03A|nr:tyrosine-protein phosphatase [Zavarzinella formosa]
MRHARILLALLLTVALVVVPARYAVARYTYLRNFRVVEDGVLYRSAQLSPDALTRVIHDYQIKTVVSFRYPEPGGVAPDLWEEEFCAKLGIKYVRIQPDVWASLDGGPIPVQKAVDEFLEVMKDPANYPVLAHCFRGVHRTGAFCSIYRMECQCWSNTEAIDELRSNGYVNLDKEESILGYMEHYVPSWKGKAK